MNDFLVLNNRKIHFQEIREGRDLAKSEFEDITLSFCRQWLNGQAAFSLKTSGSTGAPKTITVSRKQMLASAKQTIDFFKLSPGDTVLVCLNTAYIAGIMMLVRAIEAGSRIRVIEPTGNPLINPEETVDFMALVPLQLNNILEEPSSLLHLESTRATIVGGAPVSPGLINKLKRTKAAVWATFGMTETLTHFALRQLNPAQEEAYSVLNETTIQLDERGCLVVTSPVTNNEPVITNDMAELHDNQRFTWIGRLDNTINSGGVKLQIEDLEAKTARLMADQDLENNFFIGALPHKTLHHQVCLLVEASEEIEALKEVSFENYFSKYEAPKRIVFLPRFVYTPTGKINRAASLQLVDLLS